MRHSTITALALALLLLPSSARVLWMPEDLNPLAGSASLIQRDTSTCVGNTTLNHCGGDMPADFCCPVETVCMALSTTSSITAAICCPKGEDCSIIAPVSCDIGLQNTPETQLHVSPPQQLSTCGIGCCPMGYRCDENSQCNARSAPTPASGTGAQSAASPPTETQNMTGATSEPTVGGAKPLGNPVTAKSDFDGKSFAAGFIPGIILGALLAACLIFLILRKRRSSRASFTDDKQNNRDTLTDLGPLDRRPTMHGRSISEPKVDPSTFHRTDFLRTTPPKTGNPTGTYLNYRVDIRSPASAPPTPSTSPPKIRALFSRSPFMNQTPSTPVPTQPPMPAHLKRGTLSFKISPVRALKKQKSSHSLHRQMTDASCSNENARRTSRRRMRPDRSRSASTETIQVLMPSNEPYTPDRPPQIVEELPTLGTATYQPPKSASTWHTSGSTPDDTPDERQPLQARTPYPTSSRYPSEVQPYTTPTRPPIPRQQAKPAVKSFLASPYTPTYPKAVGRSKTAAGGVVPRLGLNVDHNDTRRDTTFSAMMAQAGLRKSDLIMGTGTRRAK